VRTVEGVSILMVYNPAGNALILMVPLAGTDSVKTTVPEVVEIVTLLGSFTLKVITSVAGLGTKGAIVPAIAAEDGEQEPTKVHASVQ
jgi:hypothetical protein